MVFLNQNLLANGSYDFRRSIIFITPSITLLETNSCPDCSQNTLKSSGAAGSVANTFNSSPIFTDFINFRARRTGKGHFNPWTSKSPKLNPFKSFGWGTWIRTRDHGIKTRCLTAWLCPILQRKNKRV